MTYLVIKIAVYIIAAGLLGFVIGWWWTRQNERRRSSELEGVWIQKVQRANRELDALRADLRNESNRTYSASEAENTLRSKLAAAEKEIADLRQQSARATPRDHQPAVDEKKFKELEARYQGQLREKDASLAKLLAQVAEQEPVVVALKQELKAKQEELSSVQAQLKAPAAPAGPDHEVLAKLQADLKAKSEAITSLQAELAKSQKDLQGRSDRLSQLESSLKQSQSSGQSQLANLQAELKAKSEALSKLETETLEMLQAKESEVAGLLAKVKPLEQLAEAARLKDQEIEALRLKVSELEPQITAWSERFSAAMAAAAAAAPPSRPQPPQDDRDDLKQIRGIGPVLEKKLNAMGILRFREIATWSEEDIDRVQAQLPEFKNRIRRDNWVVSARDAHLQKYGEAIQA